MPIHKRYNSYVFSKVLSFQKLVIKIVSYYSVSSYHYQIIMYKTEDTGRYTPHLNCKFIKTYICMHTNFPITKFTTSIFPNKTYTQERKSRKPRCYLNTKRGTKQLAAYQSFRLFSNDFNYSILRVNFRFNVIQFFWFFCFFFYLWSSIFRYWSIKIKSL